jgi:hypothetical protein
MSAFTLNVFESSRMLRSKLWPILTIESRSARICLRVASSLSTPASRKSRSSFVR